MYSGSLDRPLVEEVDPKLHIAVENRLTKNVLQTKAVIKPALGHSPADARIASTVEPAKSLRVEQVRALPKHSSLCLRPVRLDCSSLDLKCVVKKAIEPNRCSCVNPHIVGLTIELPLRLLPATRRAEAHSGMRRPDGSGGRKGAGASFV